MTVFINSFVSTAIDSQALVLSFQIISVFTLMVFLIGKLLTAASMQRSRFAHVLTQAIKAPLVSLLMVFSIIALLRVVLIIQQ